MKKCFLSTYHPLKDAKYPLTSFVHGINATPPTWNILHGWSMFKLPNGEEAIFWLGVAWWFSFEKVISFVGTFTQGVTLDMVGIFPMCWSIRFNNLFIYLFQLVSGNPNWNLQLNFS
jgi:hypothetical protein